MDEKEIRVHTDKRGRDHIDIYSNDPQEDHNSIHINWDSDTGNGTIVDTTSGDKEKYVNILKKIIVFMIFFV